MISEQAFRLKKNGELRYRGFCRHPELIENYDKAVADETQTWQVHHRLESCFTQRFLKEMNLYYDVEPEALIFLTPSEHSKMDSRCRRVGEARKGKKLSEEHKRKMSESLINHKDLSKKVLCVETGEVFDSTMDVERKTGINSGNISMACNGKRKTAGGFHWKFAQ